MDTPIYDFLRSYASAGGVRGHMPGHKGRSPVPELEWLYRYDITEIYGADSLFEAEGIIAECEKNFSALYGTAGTVLSAGGSTLCIQAMLTIMKREGRKVIAARNVHRAFLNAAALLDLDIQWAPMKYSSGLLSGQLDLEVTEELLRQGTQAACVYVTSPDYTGAMADIPELSRICKRYGARLIVDCAHGAHLAFMPENMHPIALGADMCCDSAHKMLPALTGAALLHTSRPEYAAQLKQAMSLFASTSPSYPIMLSLDLCCKYISEDIRRDISRGLAYIERFRGKFRGRLAFAEGEPFHITVKAAESGLDGLDLAQKLRESGTECEYADRDLVIFLMSPWSEEEDFLRMTSSMEKAMETAERRAPETPEFRYDIPAKRMSVREAVFADSEVIPVGESLGRICGAVQVPCPPAIPIAASGEEIDRECINIFKRYGIKNVNVVK